MSKRALMTIPFPLILVTVLLGCTSRRASDGSEVTGATASPFNVPPASIFELPRRLRLKSGAYIDVGDGGGFAGPTLVDLDGDGDRDLVVGQFNGRFRLYHNIGDDTHPAYAAPELIRAGRGHAHVPMG